VSDTCQWGIQAGARANSDPLDSSWGTPVTASDAITYASGGDMQISGATGAMTVLGSPAVGEMIFFNLYRDTSADAMAEDAWLFGLVIQYTADEAVAAW